MIMFMADDGQYNSPLALRVTIPRRSYFYYYETDIQYNRV